MLRKKYKIPLSMVAKHLGMQRDALYLIEREREEVDPETLYKIFDAIKTLSSLNTKNMNLLLQPPTIY